VIETQEEVPEIREPLRRVGITNLRSVAKINWKGKVYTFLPLFEVTIDVPAEKKGIHMSRLVESITEAMSERLRRKSEKPTARLRSLERPL